MSANVLDDVTFVSLDVVKCLQYKCSVHYSVFVPVTAISSEWWGAEPPAGSRGRAPGQGIRGA